MLETRELTKAFGGLVAVDGVSMTVSEGDVHSVIGPNGAGKTTLFDLLTGRVSPTSGDITMAGERITGLDPNEAVRHGIARSFQVTNIFPGLTVRKNIRIAAQREAGFGWNFWSKTDGIDSLEARVDEIMAEVGMDVDPETRASAMSHGEKRLLEIAIVLAQDPSILLLDEPAAGMSAEESREIIDLIRSLNERYTILLIEHDIDLVMELSDVISVMVDGSIVAEGTPEEVAASERVQEAYLGGGV